MTKVVMTSLDTAFVPLSSATTQDFVPHRVTRRPHAANGVLAGAFPYLRDHGDTAIFGARGLIFGCQWHWQWGLSQEPCGLDLL